MSDCPLEVGARRQSVTASVHILLVDDDPTWRRFVRSILTEDTRLEVIAEGSDGVEAVQRAEESKPDLILLDINRPGLNGIDAARRIRKVSPKSRIIFVTENPSLYVLRDALAVGGHAFVIKSRAIEELLPTIDSVLR